MKKLKLLFTTCALLLGVISANAQTNLIAGWDGGNDTSSPSNFGWTSSANRTLNARNANGGIRMTTNYSGYKLENGTSYSYSSSSDPSSVIFWVRYNTSGESFTYTFQGLEADSYYDFSALIGWHNNSDAPTFTIKINDSNSDLATMSKAISTKQTLYSVSSRFKTPSTMTSTTNVKIVFTCNKTGDCMEAISALRLVNVVVKDELQAALAYANRVNSELSNSTLASAITTAQGVYDNASATQAQVNEAIPTLYAAVAAAISEDSPSDISWVLANPGFEGCTVTTTNAAASGSAAPLDIAGEWTQSSSAAWSSSAVVAYGGAGQVNGASAPSTDNAGNSGNTLGVSVGWGGLVTYQSPAILLPAGVYTLRVKAYNANTETQFTSKFGFVPTTGDATLSTKNSFTASTWETDEVTFTLNAATEGKIQVGGQAVSGGSGSNAKVFFDNITLAYENPLAGAITAWNNAHSRLEDLDATLLPDAAEQAITEELAKARPNTQEAIESATAALQALIDSYESIKAAYDKVNKLITFVTGEVTNSTGTKTTIEQAINTATTNKETRTTAEDLANDYNTLETARQTYVTGGAQPTADHVFDFTFKIPDAAVTSANDWTNKRTASDQQYTGAPDNTYFDNYNENRNIQKNIGVLLLGKYQLKCATRAHADVTVGNIYFSQNNANLNQTDINHVGNTGGDLGNGWSWTTVSFDNFDNSNDITLGFYSECGSSKWAGADDFHLYYKGNAVDDETATALLNTVETRKMNADVASAQTSAKTNFENQKSFDNYNALKAAIDAAKTSAENYAKVKAAIDETAETVATLDDAGQAAYNNNISSVQSAYDNGSITNEDYEEKIADVKAALIAAVKAQTTAGSDWTLLITNPSFESDFSGWTNTEMATQSNDSFTLKEGSKYVEKWQPNGTFSVSQTIKAMPTGVYRISAAALAQGVTSAKIKAGGVETAVTIGGAAANYSVEFACDANADITIGFEGVGTGVGASWLCVDNFTMTLVSAGLPDVVAVDGKMNADVAQAQTEAIATYNNDKTVANYNAASEAIKAAQASKDAYTAAATYIAKAKDVKTNQNFASATAITTFADAIEAIETPYNNNTLTTEAAAAAGTTLGVAATGWHANPNGAAVKYLNDGFSLNDFDQALYVNTWSTEGENDLSGFVVPFYEYYTGNSNSLAEKTWTGKLTGLANGQYMVQLLVRARIKDDANDEENMPSQATGLSIDINGYEGVNFSNNMIVLETRFRMAECLVVGLVKDGVLNLNINVAAENNISWLSFKNVKYTKVRDLTPEEAAVKPTAIALDPTTVTLNATTNTATLTPTFTPQDATQTVTWTSSDEGVATVNNGVVTGVAPGTATITVTSTLDENIKATATVTVSYPESKYAKSSYTNEGATRTIYALGENIIKNGSFEYPNGYYGWKNGAGGDLAAANFDIVTDGDNKYLRAKNSKGAGDANSISTGWPIEAGKTYVFGYKVKASTTVSDKSKFLVVSMTNEIGTETLKVSKDDETVNTEWNSIKYEFTNTEGYAYVQFRARWLANSLSFDDFYLAEATTTTVGNVDYATNAIPTANIGTGAFQYSQDAIDAANALEQGTATVDDVEAAYNALQVINAPADNQVFNIIMGTLTWTNNNNATMLATEGKAATYLAGDRTDHGLYNIKYSVEPNVNCAQAFKFTPVEGTVNGYKLSQIDAEGNQRYICTVTGGGYGNNNTSGIRTTTDASKALTVIVIPTTEGVYNLRNTEANALLGAQDAGFYTVTGRNNNLIIRETSKPSITINTTAAGWGTTILPFAVTSLPEGVKVYTISESNGNALTMVEHDAIEANKPYVIEGAWSETLTGDALGKALKNTEGLLVGTYTRIPAPNGSYILQKQGDKVGFFKVDTSVAEPNVPANRAYLSEEASSVRGFLLDDSEVITAINAVKALTEGEALIYDMNGVQQPRLKKGMNIIRTKDGRTQKVMVR